jgi:hypothetical protein
VSIKWNKQNPSNGVIKTLFPETKVKDTSLGKAFQSYVGTLTVGQTKHGASYGSKKYLAELGENKKINSLTFSEIAEMFKKLQSKYGLTETGATVIRSELMRLIRFTVTGDASSRKAPVVSETSTNGHKPDVSLKISRVSIENLQSMMPMFEGGRFRGLKAELKRELIETPTGQFALIHAKEMAENKKERTAAGAALSKMLTDNKLDWLIRWTGQEKGFLVVRRSDWEKVKGGRK